MFFESWPATIAAHPHIAYPLVLLVALAESLAVIGLLVPGTVLIFGAGVLIATGALALTPTLLVAIAGAIAGDAISYWLGRIHHQRLRTFWPFSRHPRLLTDGEEYFRRHGAASILMGRFIGPIRPVIPLIAGMLGMAPLPFALVNVASAVAWAIAILLPGVFFGTSLALAGEISARLTLLFLLLAGLLWLAVWLCRQLFLGYDRYWRHRWQERVSQWLALDLPPTGGFAMAARRLAVFLLMPRREERHLLLFLVLAFFFMSWAFLGITEDVLTRDPLVRTDLAVYHFFQGLRTQTADRLFVSLTELGDGFVTAAVAVAILLFLLGGRHFRTAGLWAATLAGGELLTQIFKWTLRLPRPVSIYDGVSTFGFPSGHTTMSVILYGFLALLVGGRSRSPKRWAIFGSSLLIALLIAFSRLYLGAHWLSDVLGGFALGSLWIALAGIALLKSEAEPFSRKTLALVAAATFFTAAAWHVAERHAADMERYAARPPIRLIDRVAWRMTDWATLPAWRSDLEGNNEQPLTVQWSGTPAQLARHLATAGWQAPPALAIKPLLAMLAPDADLAGRPVLPRLHDGRTEAFLLVRPALKGRWVLRLWPTDFRCRENGVPLWVGTVEAQESRSLAGLLTLPRVRPDYDLALTFFARSLTGNGAITMSMKDDAPPPGRRRVLLISEKGAS